MHKEAGGMDDVASWAALLLRAGAGPVILVHGIPKLFGSGKRHEVGRAGLREDIAALGFPFPPLWGGLVAVAEVGGGVCLMLGIFTAWIAALLALIMLAATYHKQRTSGFLLSADLPFALLCMMLALVLLGDGQFSLAAMWAD
jgi:putative oxidoreductase